MRLAAAVAQPQAQPPMRALITLQRHLQQWGAHTSGRGFTARSGCTAAVMAPRFGGDRPTADRIGRQQRLDPIPHRISDH
jgi:hypothetical protein